MSKNDCQYDVLSLLAGFTQRRFVFNFSNFFFLMLVNQTRATSDMSKQTISLHSFPHRLSRKLVAPIFLLQRVLTKIITDLSLLAHLELVTFQKAIQETVLTIEETKSE